MDTYSYKCYFYDMQQLLWKVFLCQHRQYTEDDSLGLHKARWNFIHKFNQPHDKVFYILGLIDEVEF